MVDNQEELDRSESKEPESLSTKRETLTTRQKATILAVYGASVFAALAGTNAVINYENELEIRDQHYDVSIRRPDGPFSSTSLSYSNDGSTFIFRAGSDGIVYVFDYESDGKADKVDYEEDGVRRIYSRDESYLTQTPLFKEADQLIEDTFDRFEDSIMDLEARARILTQETINP